MAANFKIQGGNKAQKTSADVIIQREKRGQCPTCGYQTHRVGCFGLTRKPLTIKGRVDNGMCLTCHPQGSGSLDRKAGKGGKKAQKKHNAPRKATPTKKSTAQKLGDVVLQGNGYTGNGEGQFGMYTLQAATQQGRPTYKKLVAANYQGQDRFLFYTRDGYWRVGTDTSATNKGVWRVKSTAKTPDAIVATWIASISGKDVNVPAVKVVKHIKPCRGI